MKMTIRTNAGKFADKLESISEKRLNAWIRFTFREEAEDFAKYVQDAWLRGRAMERITGETADSVQPWTKNNVIKVRPGVRVPGSLNYLGRFVGTEKEFMRPAWAEFSRGRRVQKAVDKNIEKMLEEVINADTN